MSSRNKGDAYRFPLVFHVLRHIYTHPDISITDMSYDLRHTQATMSICVSRLLKSGLIEKKFKAGNGSSCMLTYIGDEGMITHLDQTMKWLTTAGVCK